MNTHTKPELLIRVNKQRPEVFDIDAITYNQGREVLGLTSYHCHLNPIELIWAQVKMEVRKNNSNDRQTLQRVDELTKQTLANVKWRKVATL